MTDVKPAAIARWMIAKSQVWSRCRTSGTVIRWSRTWA